MSKRGVIGGLLLIAALVGACGASPEYTGSAPALAPMEGVAAVKGWDVDEAGEGYRVAATAFDSVDGGAQTGETVDRMIIWNADISLMVDDTQTAADQVRALALNLGGYTVSSESWLLDDQLHARLTIRIPAGDFEEAMGKLRELAIEVDRESSDSEDVTDQYVDLESRLRHLEAKEEQLLGFMAEAEDTEAVLAVYEHLSATQAEIEQVKGRMTYLEKLSAMATITVELYPEEAEPQVVEEGWKPGRTLRRAARALVNALEALGNAIIWFGIYVLPVLIVVALPIGFLVWLLRRRKAHRARS